MIVTGLYVLAMLVVAVMPATAASAMHAPASSVAVASGCDTGADSMSQDTHASKASDACGVVDHPSSSACLTGSVCAHLPSAVFASVVPSRRLSSDEQSLSASSPSLFGRDPAPGLRPPCLSA
ncbi:MAG: hypothetical protein H6Q99_2198 [Proteobacteria bacterium]|nr:hypothetical protein [Pseudomonadota bacterium]